MAFWSRIHKTSLQVRNDSKARNERLLKGSQKKELKEVSAASYDSMSVHTRIVNAASISPELRNATRIEHGTPRSQRSR
jgi:hypothetical protein